MSYEATAITELEAVNSLLATIGEAPVNTLSSDLPCDVSTARSLIHNTSRQVQSEGWLFNSEYEFKLLPTLNHEFIIPSNVLDFRTNSNHHPRGQYVNRGGKIYDRETHSFTIKDQSCLYCDLILMLDFGDLPQVARNYITARAARVFTDQVVGSQVLSMFNAQNEKRARANLVESEGRNSGQNILNNIAGLRR